MGSYQKKQSNYKYVPTAVPWTPIPAKPLVGPLDAPGAKSGCSPCAGCGDSSGGEETVRSEEVLFGEWHFCRRIGL